MLPDVERGSVRFGCFLVIPLKYDAASFVWERLEEIGVYQPLTTMDINENIKAMLDRSNEAAVGVRPPRRPALRRNGKCPNPGLSRLVRGKRL